MDKINPEISVFTTMPNNGYLALVFQDTGVAMSADCSKKDAYEGLLEVCAHFLLEYSDESPEFNKFSGEEPTPEEEAQIEKYAELVASGHRTFCEALKRRIIIGSITKQLEATGLPHIFAKMLATGMEILHGAFERAFTDDGCDDEEPDEEPDDSDDEFNLD